MKLDHRTRVSEDGKTFKYVDPVPGSPAWSRVTVLEDRNYGLYRVAIYHRELIEGKSPSGKTWKRYRTMYGSSVVFAAATGYIYKAVSYNRIPATRPDGSKYRRMAVRNNVFGFLKTGSLPHFPSYQVLDHIARIMDWKGSKESLLLSMYHATVRSALTAGFTHIEETSGRIGPYAQTSHRAFLRYITKDVDEKTIGTLEAAFIGARSYKAMAWLYEMRGLVDAEDLIELAVLGGSTPHLSWRDAAKARTFLQSLPKDMRRVLCREPRHLEVVRRRLAGMGRHVYIEGTATAADLAGTSSRQEIEKILFGGA